MSNTIKFIRGAEADIPVLNQGEPAFTTDTHKVFIGDGAENYQLAMAADVGEVNTASNIGIGAEVYSEKNGVDLEFRKLKAGSDKVSLDWYTEAEFQSQYPPEQNDTYVKATTHYNDNLWPYFATDPLLSLIGNGTDAAWCSTEAGRWNQRFHIDLGGAKKITKIYYENNHQNGATTDSGVKNFTFWGSNTGAGTFDDLVYANDEGWTELTCSQNTFDQHSAANEADPKYITVTNSTAYRYYAFKFADNYGSSYFMGVRRIELQSGDPVYDDEIVIDVDAEAVLADLTLTEADISDLGAYIGSLIEDPAPELGGDLDAADKYITGAGRISFTQELDNGSKTASFSIYFITDQKQKVTLTANVITLTLDTTSMGVGNYLLKIVNGGLATLTWASESGSIYFPGGTDPVLTASGTDIVAFYFDGTNWYGMASLDFK